MEGNKSQLTHSPHLDAAVGTVCVGGAVPMGRGAASTISEEETTA